MEGDEVDCFVECTTDVDGVIEFFDDDGDIDVVEESFWVVMEYTTDVDDCIEILVEVDRMIDDGWVEYVVEDDVVVWIEEVDEDVDFVESFNVVDDFCLVIDVGDEVVIIVGTKDEERVIEDDEEGVEVVLVEKPVENNVKVGDDDWFVGSITDDEIVITVVENEGGWVSEGTSDEEKVIDVVDGFWVDREVDDTEVM